MQLRVVLNVNLTSNIPKIKKVMQLIQKIVYLKTFIVKHLIIKINVKLVKRLRKLYLIMTQQFAKLRFKIVRNKEEIQINMLNVPYVKMNFILMIIRILYSNLAK